MSDSLNQSTTTKIDFATITYSVTSNKNSITFHNFLDIDLIYKKLKKPKKSKINKLFIIRMKNVMKLDLCQNDLYKAMLDSGVIIFSKYKSKNTKSLIGTVKLTKYDCGQQ